MATSTGALLLFDQELPDPQLRKQQPHEAPGQSLARRPTGEGVLFRVHHGDDPAGMVDVPSAIAAAIGDGGEERVLQGAALERRIDASFGDGARQIGGEDALFRA